MSYQALYRVWRPRKFVDVVGQSHITRTLQNAISQNKFSHAYLFSGPRGTGKTSAAKIFAQTVNCEKGPVKEPCNECAACLGILDGSISDVIEIDAASNTSVDDIREIRDKVKYAPSSVPYKVYIIDEVHMISTNAFNALLKTLEEPPAHVVFILATTEPHKIPLTIISRCQRFDFKPIGSQAIVERMMTITEAEHISVTRDALETVALTAEGGMRDALSILDQAISYSGETVELEDVLAVTGSVSQHILTDIITAMYHQDVKQALESLDDLIQNGKDPGRFVFDLIYFLRDVLLYKSAPGLENVLERALIDDSFKQLTEKISAPWIQQAIIQLNECQQEIKWTNSPKVFIEIAILTITNEYEQPKSEASTEIDSGVMPEVMTRIEKIEKDLSHIKETPVVQKDAPKQRRSPSRSNRNGYKIPYEKIRAVLDVASKPALVDVQKQWAAFLEQLKASDAPAHATIQDSKPAAASDTAIVVAFRYDIHCSLFLDNQEKIESVLARTVGNPLSIIPIPEGDWQKLRNEYIHKTETKPTDESDEKEDPLIEKARHLVGDDLLQIHD